MNPTSSESMYLLGPRLLALYTPSKSPSTEPRDQRVLFETQSHDVALPLSVRLLESRVFTPLYPTASVWLYFLILELNGIEAE